MVAVAEVDYAATGVTDVDPDVDPVVDSEVGADYVVASELTTLGDTDVVPDAVGAVVELEVVAELEAVVELVVELVVDEDAVPEFNVTEGAVALTVAFAANVAPELLLLTVGAPPMTPNPNKSARVTPMSPKTPIMARHGKVQQDDYSLRLGVFCG